MRVPQQGSVKEYCKRGHRQHYPKTCRFNLIRGYWRQKCKICENEQAREKYRVKKLVAHHDSSVRAERAAATKSIECPKRAEQGESTGCQERAIDAECAELKERAAVGESAVPDERAVAEKSIEMAKRAVYAESTVLEE